MDWKDSSAAKSLKMYLENKTVNYYFDESQWGRHCRIRDLFFELCQEAGLEIYSHPLWKHALERDFSYYHIITYLQGMKSNYDK